MSFQKPPLTPELIAQNRAESHAQLVRLAGRSPTLALQPFIDEEVAHLEAMYGRDDRLVYLAITNVLMEVEADAPSSLLITPPLPACRRIGTGCVAILRCLLTDKSRLRGLLGSRLARCRADDEGARSVYQQAASWCRSGSDVMEAEDVCSASTSMPSSAVPAMPRPIRTPRSGSYAFVGDALLEAVEIVQRFDEGESFDDPMLAGWARYMRECSGADRLILTLLRIHGETPEYHPTVALYKALIPLDYGLMISWELEEAFILASDRAGETFFGQLLREGLRSVLFSKKYLEMKFERDRDELVGDWLAKLRVPPGYVPRGNPRQLLPFFTKRFSYRLWDQKRRVGDHTVIRLGWLADLKRRDLVEPGVALTEEAIADLRDKSAARMTRPPPAGFTTSAGLGGILQERQELATLAGRIVEAERSGSRPDELREETLASSFLGELNEWFAVPLSKRAALPPLALPANVATSPRSVDKLVEDYESHRGFPFDRDPRDARSRLIPLSEVEQIVVFATARASRKRARDGSRHPPAEPPT